jgi:hypothetical protein
MKNTESIGWLYDWFTFSPDYVRGMKQKLRTWSEDETDTGTTTEANEPIEVDDDLSHKANENNGPCHILARLWCDGAAQSDLCE